MPGLATSLWPTSFYSLTGPAGDQVSTSDSSPQPDDSGWTRSGQRAAGEVTVCHHWYLTALSLKGEGPITLCVTLAPAPSLPSLSVDRGRCGEHSLTLQLCSVGTQPTALADFYTSPQLSWTLHNREVMSSPPCTPCCYILSPQNPCFCHGRGQAGEGVSKANDHSCPGLRLSPRPTLTLCSSSTNPACIRRPTGYGYAHS